MPISRFSPNAQIKESRTELSPNTISHKEISVDQKLELIRQVRSQYRQNQNDLMHRESILYDRPMRPAANSDGAFPSEEIYSETYYEPYKTSKKGSQTTGTLKFRLLFSVLLTVLVISFHQTHTAPAGIHMEQVFLALEQDYEDVILSWSSTLIQPKLISD